MLNHAVENFKAMRPSVKALVFLYWIYSFAGSMVGVFTQLFLYQRFTSLPLNIIATILFYTGIMLGFCIPGFIAAVRHLNIKQGFFWSFVLMGVSILYLLGTDSMIHAYLAMLFWGVGQGVFWLTVNTFELAETEDHERDFYSSALRAGNQVLSLAGPASAVFLIWLSDSILHLGTYTLLFTVAPAVYLLGFFCFSRIRDYRPQPIRWADVRHFFVDRRNQAAQIYMLGSGFQDTLGVIIPPLVILAILGTTLRVGLYNALFAAFSAVCVIVIARYRTPENRLAIYGVTTAVLAAVTAWFGWAFSLAALVIYTVVEGVISPILGVSSHVIDLSSMEIGRKGSDFYATMVLREIFLWIWRSAVGIAFLILVGLLGTEHASLSSGLYLLAAGIVITYAGAFLFLRLSRKTATGVE